MCFVLLLFFGYSVKKIIARIKKQVKRSKADNFACPCCNREFQEEDEIKEFERQMKLLASSKSPLLRLDSGNKVACANYSEWKKAVSENVNGVLNHGRISVEVKALEKRVSQGEDELGQLNRSLESTLGKRDDLQVEVENLRELLEASKRWVDAGNRVAEKRRTINEQKMELSMSCTDFGGRDLKVVESELNARLESKEQHSNQVR